MNLLFQKFQFLNTDAEGCINIPMDFFPDSYKAVCFYGNALYSLQIGNDIINEKLDSSDFLS
jgi:hypothetical protein